MSVIEHDCCEILVPVSRRKVEIRTGICSCCCGCPGDNDVVAVGVRAEMGIGVSMGAAVAAAVMDVLWLQCGMCSRGILWWWWR